MYNKNLDAKLVRYDINILKNNDGSIMNGEIEEK